MNILITGSAGFVGTHLCARLVGDSHELSFYDLAYGQDICYLHALDKAFECAQPNLVIHLAARTGVRRSHTYPGEYITTNIEGTWNVGKMCEKYGCRLINFSSSSVYGKANPPTKEDDPKKPISLYGMTKLIGELVVEQLSIPTVTIRPFTIYGAQGRRDQVFYKWINQIKAGKNITVYRGENSCRGYTHIFDIISALKTLIAMKWSWQHEDFNLGGDEVIPIMELHHIFCSTVVGLDHKTTFLDPPEEDVPANYANIDKARTILGYVPKQNFKENIKQIIHSELRRQ